MLSETETPTSVVELTPTTYHAAGGIVRGKKILTPLQLRAAANACRLEIARLSTLASDLEQATRVRSGGATTALAAHKLDRELSQKLRAVDAHRDDWMQATSPVWNVIQSDNVVVVSKDDGEETEAA